jgi:hypothetical protein
MTIAQMNERTISVACSLAAIGPAELPRHREVAAALFGSAIETQEDAGGYSFRLPPDTATVLLAAEFVTRERLCCPFYTFTIEVGPAGGSLWLRLTGPEGAKEVLRSGLDELLADPR